MNQASQIRNMEQMLKEKKVEVQMRILASFDHEGNKKSKLDSLKKQVDMHGSQLTVLEHQEQEMISKL